MSSQSLWADLSDIQKIRTPRTILLEQAEFLTQATKGALVAKVSEGPAPNGQFVHTLGISVPALNEYKVTVLTVAHGIDLYPVRVRASKPPTDVPCQDEDTFLEVLRSVLSSAELRRLLARLLAQIT